MCLNRTYNDLMCCINYGADKKHRIASPLRLMTMKSVLPVPDLTELPLEMPAEDADGAPRTGLDRLPFTFAKKQGAVIVPDGDHQKIVYRPGLSSAAFAELNRLSRGALDFEVVSEQEFEEYLNLAYQSDSAEAMQMVEGLGDDMDLASLANSVPETEDLLEQEDDAPIIRLINAILTEAVKTAASDVHIETFEKQLVVRFRIDGILREIVKPKRALAPLLVSRIKVMSKLDIAEKRVPQDGRISLRVGGREVDIRVSTMPSANGERIVLRLLDKNAGRLSISHLGMRDRKASCRERV